MKNNFEIPRTFKIATIPFINSYRKLNKTFNQVDERSLPLKWLNKGKSQRWQKDGETSHVSKSQLSLLLKYQNYTWWPTIHL